MRDAFTIMVEAAIDALPADQRAALIMKDGEGLSYADIGERMSISATAARELYVQAMLALRQATDP